MDTDDFEINETLMAIQPAALTLEQRIDSAAINDIDAIVTDIAAIESATRRAILIDRLARKTKAGKAAVAQDVQREIVKNKTTKTEGQSNRIISAKFPGLIDLALDIDDNVAFIIRHDDILTGLSTLSIFEEWAIGDITYTPPAKEHIPFLLPRGEEVLKWYNTGEDKTLFQDIIAYLKQFSFLPENQWVIPASCALVSYLQDHPNVFYLPTLLFFGGPERGKSRIGKSIAHISFRGVHLIDLSPANIFRLSDELQATLFFDMKDLWHAAQKEGSVDILLGRFEKGPMIRRVTNPDRGPFADSRYYNIFGPTILATNSPIHTILNTRCIHITMPDRPDQYQDAEPVRGRKLKERLVAWRARILDLTLPEIAPVEGLIGRLWDISKPLFQVCTIAYPDALETLTESILEIAGEKTPEKNQTFEATVVRTLKMLSPTGLIEWRIPMEDLLIKLNEQLSEGYYLQPGVLGKLIKSLGLPTKRSGGYTKILVTRQDLDALVKQYGIELKPTEDVPPDSNVQQVVDDLLINIETNTILS